MAFGTSSFQNKNDSTAVTNSGAILSRNRVTLQTGSPFFTAYTTAASEPVHA
jgi:hypothetical protein